MGDVEGLAFRIRAASRQRANVCGCFLATSAPKVEKKKENAVKPSQIKAASKGSK